MSISKIRLTVGGIVWLAAVQFFIAQIIAQSRWPIPFSLMTNYISDLGNTECAIYQNSGTLVCSPWHAIMNLSFLLQGIIIITGTILVRPAFISRRANDLCALTLIITALCIIGVGLFPENENHRMHVLTAGVQFITSGIAMINFAWANKPLKHWQNFSRLSMVLGVTGLIATVLFSHGYDLGLGIGGMERIAAYVLPVWLIIAGIKLVKQPIPAGLVNNG